MADEVLRELEHELGGCDGTVVDLHVAVWLDEFHSVERRVWMREMVDAGYVVAHHMKAPWDCVEAQELDAHMSIYLFKTMTEKPRWENQQKAEEEREKLPR